MALKLLIGFECCCAVNGILKLKVCGTIHVIIDHYATDQSKKYSSQVALKYKIKSTKLFDDYSFKIKIQINKRNNDRSEGNENKTGR